MGVEVVVVVVRSLAPKKPILHFVHEEISADVHVSDNVSQPSIGGQSTHWSGLLPAHPLRYRYGGHGLQSWHIAWLESDLNLPDGHAVQIPD